MRIEFEIMHGVDRADRNAVVETLRKQIRSDVPVQTDPRHRGPLNTFLKCVRHAQDELFPFDWLVVIQDDAQPVVGWRDHLAPILRQSPEPVLGLSSGGYEYRKPRHLETDYQVGRFMTQGGAFAIRADLIEAGFVEWATPLLDEGYFNDDTVIAAFAWWTGAETAVVTKSLFTQDLPTTIKGHWKWTAQPHKTVEDAYPQYDVNAVERPRWNNDDPQLWALIRHRWNLLESLVATDRRREEIPIR